MSNQVDMTGKKFGRLTAIKAVGSNELGRLKWLFRCDCGELFITDGKRVRRGNTTSCGCYKKECLSRNGKRNKVHGLSKTKLGKTWNAMIYRCYCEKAISYPFYGAIGIKVCEFLRASPLNLKELIGDRPKGCTIDRIEVRGNYSCGSCSECLKNCWTMNIRWATGIEQGRNKRNSRMLTFDGVTKCVAEWEEIYGLHRSTIHQRMARGWSGKQLIQPAVRTKNQHST